MMHKDWCGIGIGEVPYFFKVIHQISRSQGTEIANFDPNVAYLDCNPSLNCLNRGISQAVPSHQSPPAS